MLVSTVLILRQGFQAPYKKIQNVVLYTVDWLIVVLHPMADISRMFDKAVSGLY